MTHALLTQLALMGADERMPAEVVAQTVLAD